MRKMLVFLVLLTGCTNTQLSQWMDWYQKDPAAATEFANRPEIQAQLRGEQEQQDSQYEPRGDVWDNLAWCESGGNWSYNGGSGYDGGLQFAPSTWRAYNGEEFASHAWGASREQQVIVAERILNDVGWQAWPACSRKLGLR